MPAPRHYFPLLALCVLAFTALCAQAFAYTGTATTTTLQVTPVCLSQGCVTTLTATVVAGPAAVHPGLVYFCDGSAATCEKGLPVGQAQLIVNGTATIKRVLSPGVHHLHAVFHGTSAYSASSSATQDLTVAASTAIATQTSIATVGNTVPPNAVRFFGGVTSLGPSAPTGSISFRDTGFNNTVLATEPLGAGTSPAFTYSTGGLDFSQIPGTILASASRPIAGDFNNDGFQDILVLDQAGLQVLLGSSTGKFTAAPKGANSLPSVVGSMVVADFNGDGKLDIAFGDASGKSIHVSFGNGDGTFTDAKATTPLANTPGLLYLGDFNNDGIPDLIADVQVAASQSSPASYEFQPLLGKGDGTFTATSATYSIGASGPAIVADFDSDGTQDLLVATAGASGSVYPGQFAVLHGNGDGTFGNVPKLSPNFNVVYMVAGDFNGDGILDVVTFDETIGVLAYWQGVGDGTFVQLNSVSPVPFESSYLSSLITGDFDGDGVLDVGGIQTDETQQTAPSAFTAFLHFNDTDPYSLDFPLEISTPDISANPLGEIPVPFNTANLVVGAFSSNGLPSVVYFNPGTSGAAPFSSIAAFDSAAVSTQTGTFNLDTAGIHNVVASYPGDSSHAASVSAPVTFVVPQISDSTAFTSSAGLALNGGASLQSGALQLTDGKNFEAHSTFAATRLPVYSFKTSFAFQIPSGNGDGFAFVIQSNGPNAVGSSGGGLGYGDDPGATGGPSITNSLALVFDLHNNQGEGANSVRIETGGITSPAGSIDLTTSGINLHSGDLFNAQITGNEDGDLIQLTLTDLNTNQVFQNTFAANLFAAINDTVAYVGFTSGTGATTSTVNILNWTFAGNACCQSMPPTASVPNFASGFTGASSQLQLNHGAAIAASSLQLTNGTNFEATSAYFKAPITPYDWTTDFDFQITGSGGDGFTFITQSVGLNTFGTSGDYLGYGPAFSGVSPDGYNKSFAVKFDVHNNAGEGNNSTGIYLAGAIPTVPAVDLTPSRVNLTSGHTFHAHMYFDPEGYVNLSVTDLTVYAVFNTRLHVGTPASPAYVGFTAGTGATTNTINILNWTWNYEDVAF